MKTRHTIVLVMSVLVSACAADGSVDEPVAELEWRPCSMSEAECAVIEVPYDHDRPEIGSFDLPIARHRARDADRRIGILVVNPGGPGGGGRWMAEDAELYFSDEILDRFDIVGFDPRGNGGARPELECTEDMDSYFSLDPSPDDLVERTALVDGAKNFVDGCVMKSSEILPYLGTEATARDIDLIRRMLGESTVSYFGLSYGSELGATWATLFPDTVRAAVLDAAADPNLDLIDWLTLQSSGFENLLESFLDQCDADGCEMSTPGETARQTFDRIMNRLDDTPLVVDFDRPAVGHGAALIGIVAALYSPAAWDGLDRALADADDGFGDRLLTSYDDYFGGYQDGHSDDLIDAYVAISCLDRTRSFDVEEAFAAMDGVRLVSPRLGATVLPELLLCAQWPVDPKPAPGVRWTGDRPILVVGSTGDPATPLAGTRRMHETLGNSRLVVVESFEHTSYGSNECATEAVDRYLVDLVVHDGELAC
jgi:pimeloyl-ACP methyl ester carboxylesterase